jgi:hypothetical protein
MELKPIKKLINQILIEYNAPCIRYRGFAISTYVIEELPQIIDTLKILLPDYTLWELGQQEAPQLPIHRIDFVENAFETHKAGLIIYLPENWMFDWPKLEQRAFWSALSETYGKHTVIAVFADTFETTPLVEAYFNVKSLSSLSIRLWISKYQP